MKYRREVDGLRALAVLPVILYHAGFSTFSGGFVGVDVFFVISGYLITTLMMSEHAAGTFTLLGFYERRARRILPALFLVMFACLPFAWFWLLPVDLSSFSESLVAVPLFSSNLLFWKTSGYFDISTELRPLIHTWSLAVEEQYYLFFPLLLAVTWRTGIRRVATVLMIIAAASFALAEWGSSALPTATYYLLPARAWELLIGALVALWIEPGLPLQRHRAICNVAAALGVALVAYSVFSFDQHTPFPGRYAVVPTVGTALIICFASPNTFVGSILSSGPLVSVGLISYSAYLWHQPILAFAKNRSLEIPSKALLGALAALSVALAYVSWKYVEQPFRRRSFLSRKQLFSVCLACSGAFISIGLVGYVMKGFEGRFHYKSAYEGDVGHLDFQKYMAEHDFPCADSSIAAAAPEVEGFTRCHQSRRDKPVEVVLLGDSHAEHLFIGMAEALPDKNVAFYIKVSYPLTINPEFETIFRELTQDSSVGAVIIAMRWSARIGDIPKTTTLSTELVKTAQTLRSAGKQVYVVDDVPTFPFDPERCKFVATELERPHCEMSAKDFRTERSTYMPALDGVAAQDSRIRRVRLGELFCDDERCSMVRNNLLMFRDNHHLSIPGSRYVGAEIVRQFPELGR